MLESWSLRKNYLNFAVSPLHLSFWVAAVVKSANLQENYIELPILSSYYNGILNIIINHQYHDIIMTPCRRSVTLSGLSRIVDAGVVIVTDIFLLMNMVIEMLVVIMQQLVVVMILHN